MHLSLEFTGLRRPRHRGVLVLNKVAGSTGYHHVVIQQDVALIALTVFELQNSWNIFLDLAPQIVRKDLVEPWQYFASSGDSSDHNVYGDGKYSIRRNRRENL